jgi:tetratricopeptide (TPR) repeat protein
MERIEEWRMQLRKELEKVAQFLQKPHPKHTLANMDLPELEKLTNTLEEKALKIFQKIEKGFKKILESLPEMFGSFKGASSKEIVQAFGDMISVASVLIHDPEPSLSFMAKGRTIQELLGVSEKTLCSMYMAAKYLYDNEQYEESASAFTLLSLLNPSYSSFWQGLGNSEYFLGKHKEALIAYNFAAQMDPNDPLPYILSAKCHIALEHFSAAKTMLGLAEATQDKSRSYQSQIERLQQELRRFLP